jgi:hypothetical protein
MGPNLELLEHNHTRPIRLMVSRLTTSFLESIKSLSPRYDCTRLFLYNNLGKTSKKPAGSRQSLAYSSTLKMEATCSSETPVEFLTVNLLLALASTVSPDSESHETHDDILLPNGSGSLFNRRTNTSLYPRRQNPS